MNRVFLTGRIKSKPEVVYTPKGDKYVLFPLWADDGDYRIDVECIGEKSTIYWNEKMGKQLMVCGTLMKTRAKSHDQFKLKAYKIYWMEE